MAPYYGQSSKSFEFLARTPSTRGRATPLYRGPGSSSLLNKVWILNAIMASSWTVGSRKAGRDMRCFYVNTSSYIISKLSHNIVAKLECHPPNHPPT